MDKAPNLTLGIPDVAQTIGISERHLKRIVARGEGPPSIRVGRRRLFIADSLRDWLKARESNA